MISNQLSVRFSPNGLIYPQATFVSKSKINLNLKYYLNKYPFIHVQLIMAFYLSERTFEFDIGTLSRWQRTNRRITIIYHHAHIHL